MGNIESTLLLGLLEIEKGGDSIQKGISFLNSINYKDWHLSSSVFKITGHMHWLWNQTGVVRPISGMNCPKEGHSERLEGRLTLGFNEDIEGCGYCKWLWCYKHLQ